MRIKKLILNNIGSYFGETIFSFDIEDLNKNIVLIGGRNGAGKTTLFESIRLCLYGYKLYGYRQNSQVYINKIKRLINDSAKKNNSAIASIDMQILIEDGYANNKFDIQRKWILEGKVVKEEYSVYKDGDLLDTEELQDFDNFLLQIIPPALFNFHFFDGENISQFLFDKVNGYTFRKAFMQLCGLDTLDLIEEQLQNNIRPQKSEENIEVQDKYQSVKAEYQIARELLEENVGNLSLVQLDIENLKDEIVSLDKKMSFFGGIDESEWRSYQEKLKVEELNREELRRFLKETANDVLPFIILKNELIKLKEQINIESKINKNKLLKDKLFDQKIRKTLNLNLRSYLKASVYDLDNSFFDILYAAMKENEEDNSFEILNLSENEQRTLLTKIDSYLDFDIIKISEAEREIRSSLKNAKSIRSKMDSKEVINSEDYLNQKNNLLLKLELNHKKQYDLQLEQMKLENNLKIVEQKYQKAYEQFKIMLKAKSVTNMSARTLLAFNELKQNLYMKYVTLVERAFSKNFNQLISKIDLLDGIYISDSFEVIAYKEIDIDKKNVRHQIKEFGDEHMQEILGERAWQLIIKEDKNSGFIKVPAKVEQHFSAGERQIFVMALYQALTEIRTVELPFVIDTPLARIDSEHRKNILTCFFARLPGQVIILSTDEEISKDGLSVLQDKISNIYLIEHQIKGMSMVKENTYFNKEVYN